MFMRRVLALMAATSCVMITQLANSQEFPNRPVRIVVPFPAGGPTDILSRAVGQRLADEWKQQVIVDNRPGGGANIGVEHAIKQSAADGYTLLMASTVHSINPSLYPKLAYDPIKDFVPIVLVAELAQILVVHPSVPAHTVKEFIELAKSQPGKLNYSSAGNVSQPHLAAELFKTMTGTDFLHVPYKGAPQAMTDLIAGHVSVSFATTLAAVPNVRSGKIRALGVSSASRLPALPDVPTIQEAGVPGYQASGFFGLVGAVGIPSAVVTKVNADVARIIKDPSMAKSLRDQGAEPVTSTPQEYAALIRDEVGKWAKVVKESGARID